MTLFGRYSLEEVGGCREENLQRERLTWKLVITWEFFFLDKVYLFSLIGDLPKKAAIRIFILKSWQYDSLKTTEKPQREKDIQLGYKCKIKLSLDVGDCFLRERENVWESQWGGGAEGEKES